MSVEVWRADHPVGVPGVPGAGRGAARHVGPVHPWRAVRRLSGPVHALHAAGRHRHAYSSLSHLCHCPGTGAFWQCFLFFFSSHVHKLLPTSLLSLTSFSMSHPDLDPAKCKLIWTRGSRFRMLFKCRFVTSVLNWSFSSLYWTIKTAPIVLERVNRFFAERLFYVEHMFSSVNY